ncbi:MAG: hypothetical protein K0S86_1368 [Geminicoccaceae bacterium]|jgi:hypothetical protein|nr:hypothetical protein [Geminicoccaceae bacterium]
MQRALVVALLVALSSGACVRVSTTRLTSAGPALPADSVRVFATQTPGEYTELAVLRARRFLARDSQVLRALRERAARLGANGLLLLNTRGSGGMRGSGTGVIIGGPSDGHVIVGNVETEVDDFERAVAIRYRAAPAVSSTPR